MGVGSIAVAFAALAGLSSSARAQAQAQVPSPSPDTAPAAVEPRGPAASAGTDGAPAAASDEDLEAAVLGGPVAPARRPGARASARPRAAMSPDAAAASAPAPGGREPRRAQRTDGDASTAGQPGDRLALALELDTSGLGSAALQGGIFVGARLPTGLILGGLLDYASSVASLTATGATASTTSQSTSTLRFGAGARMPVIRTEDGRVDLFIAGELALVRGNREVVAGPGSSYNVSALGLTVAGGPGLRLWVHDHVAVGYAAQFRVTHLGGKAGAFPQPPGTAPNADASSTDLALEGAFQLLGVF